MLCPFDATTLQVVNRSGVEIDWCPSCKGVWLERGELDKLIDMASGGPIPAPPAAAAPAPMPAPAPPPPQQYADPRSVDPRYVDPRPEPRYVDPRPDPRYAEQREYERRRDWDDDDDDWEDRQKYGDGYRQKKRKSLLSEIFDF